MDLWEMVMDSGRTADGMPAITGDDWRNLMDWEIIVSPSGSQNIGLLAASVGLGHCWHNNRWDFHKIMNAAENYLNEAWWRHEPGSSHIYGDWISLGIEWLWFWGRMAGNDAVETAARKNILASASAYVLGAGWKKERGTFPGRIATLTGARSAISSIGSDGNRYDEHGLPNRLWFIFDNPLTSRYHSLVFNKKPPFWQGILWDTMRRVGGADPRVLTRGTRSFRRMLKMRRSSWNDRLISKLNELVDNMSAIKGPQYPMHFVRNTEGSYTWSERSSSPGSTPMMYAKTWWANGRPSGWWDNMPWASESSRIGWLSVDNTMARGEGKPGHCWYSDGILSAERSATNDHFDDFQLEFVNGPKSIPVPNGAPIWHVTWRKGGAEVEVG